MEAKRKWNILKMLKSRFLHSEKKSFRNKGEIDTVRELITNKCPLKDSPKKILWLEGK